MVSKAFECTHLVQMNVSEIRHTLSWCDEALTVLNSRVCQAIAHRKSLQVDLGVACDVLIVLEDGIGHCRHLNSPTQQLRNWAWQHASQSSLFITLGPIALSPLRLHQLACRPGCNSAEDA